MNFSTTKPLGENGDPGKFRAPWFAGRSWAGFAWLKNRLRARRLLFLDDDPARAESFLSEYPQAVWVETVTDCINRLAEDWDEVHLDHDLGGRTFVDTNESDCGMEVIRWMCKEPRAYLRETRFFVHTHNSVAGLLMVLQMRASGYRAEFRPFGFDLAQMLAHSQTAPTGNPKPDAATAKPFGRWLKTLRSWRKVPKPAAPAGNDPESINRA